MVLNEETLNNCDIYIDSVGKRLPAHIARLKNILVTFTSEAPPDELRQAEHNVREAKRLRGMDRNEAAWVGYYIKYFLDPLKSISEITEQDTRRSATAKFLHQSIETAEQKFWTLFQPKDGFAADKRTGLTMPRPDWMAAFPAYSDRYIKYLNIPDKFSLQQQASTDMFEAFSEETFQNLANKGMFAHVQDSPRQQQRCQEKFSDYLCFPWFIVEFKKARQSVDFCYCQAANAGAAAVAIFDNLCQWDILDDEFSHTQPAITMTTVGEKVELWLAYESKTGTTMSVIWAGNMTKVNDVLKLRVICENIHTWATNTLKPAIKGHIKQWITVGRRQLTEEDVRSERARSLTPVRNRAASPYELVPPSTKSKSRFLEVVTPIKSRKSLSRSASPTYTERTLAGSEERPKSKRKGYTSSKSDKTASERVYSSSKPTPRRLISQQKQRAESWSFDEEDLEKEQDAFNMETLRDALKSSKSCKKTSRKPKIVYESPKSDSESESESERESDSESDSIDEIESPSTKQQQRKKNRKKDRGRTARA